MTSHRWSHVAWRTWQARTGSSPAFRQGMDLYKVLAAKMYGTTYEQ